MEPISATQQKHELASQDKPRTIAERLWIALALAIRLALGRSRRFGVV
jgi:hypothetical protein